MGNPTRLYNEVVVAATFDLDQQVMEMAKRKPVFLNGEKFGERLARLRNTAGLTQRDLAGEFGISHRMIAYYEKQTEHPPTYLLTLYAKTFGITTDELLGLKPLKTNGRKVPASRLWRRFKQVEKLPPEDRRQVVQFVDTVLDRARLKEKVTA